MRQCVLLKLPPPSQLWGLELRALSPLHGLGAGGEEELAPGAPVWQPGCTLAPRYPLYTWGKTVLLPIHNSTSGSRPKGQCQGTHWRPDLAVEAAAVGTALRGQPADWCPLETDRAGRKVRTALGKQEKPLPSLAQSDWGSYFTAAGFSLNVQPQFASLGSPHRDLSYSPSSPMLPFLEVPPHNKLIKMAPGNKSWKASWSWCAWYNTQSSAKWFIWSIKLSFL